MKHINIMGRGENIIKRVLAFSEAYMHAFFKYPYLLTLLIHQKNGWGNKTFFSAKTWFITYTPHVTPAYLLND